MPEYATGAFENTKVVVYDFCESRSGEHARRFLGDWRGSLTCDDFSGYKALIASGVTEVERLARWLLMSQDRAHADSFHVTQDFIALMLGVRRVGVSGAASEFQRRGLIEYHRGELTVLDRLGLQHVACNCYGADKRIRDELMTSRS